MKKECPSCGKKTEQIVACPSCAKEGCVEECMLGGVGVICPSCEDNLE